MSDIEDRLKKIEDKLNNPKRKDIWDKFDIISKFATGGLVMLLAFFIKQGADRIDRGITYGEFSTKLISDLSSNDTVKKVQKDLSLIALNEVLGEANPRIVLKFASKVYETDSNFSIRQTALKIIHEHSDSTYKYYLANYENRDLKTSSPADSGNAITIDPKTIAKIDTAATTSNVIPLVYIQTNAAKDQYQSLRKLLLDKGYKVPGIENINSKFDNSIRYFYESDQQSAFDLKNICSQYFGNANIEIKILYLPSLAGKNNVPKGQIEIWLSGVSK